MKKKERTLRKRDDKDAVCDVLLTALQEKFCQNYVRTGNATKACILAGYSEKGASVMGSKLLADFKIRQRIEFINRNLGELHGITRSKIIEEYEKLAFSRLTDIKNGWFGLKDFDKLTDNERAAIKEIKISQKTGDINIILHDKLAALKGLSEMLGFASKQDDESSSKSYNKKITIEVSEMSKK